MWYHDYCAGVAKRRYEVLAASAVSFFCPTCVMEQQGSEIIAALQDAVKALTAQLNELHLQLQCPNVQPVASQQQWSEVVRKGRRGKGPND